MTDIQAKTSPDSKDVAEQTDTERARSDALYAQYSSAMRFFGEVPAPQRDVEKP